MLVINGRFVRRADWCAFYQSARGNTGWKPMPLGRRQDATVTGVNTRVLGRDRQ